MSRLNELDRREFLTGSAALATAASLPINAFAQETMLAREIPGTGETLPVIGLGAPEIFIDMPEEGKELPMSVLQAMVDQGGRLFDSPSFFRPGVPIIGPIVQEMGLRDELFMTGKITVNDKDAGVEHLERLVANLDAGTPERPMDLLLIHNMRNVQEHWATLRAWKDAGRTRYIGVSLTRNADYVDFERFMRAEQPDFIMTGYSIHHPLAEESCLPLAADLGIGVLIVEAFKATDDGGIFSVVGGKELPEWAPDYDIESWAQFSLKFILSNPAVNGIVTETRQVRHVIDNMRGGYGIIPDQAGREKMREYLLTI